MKKEDVIRQLNLEPLPEEGGLFCQTFKSPLRVHVEGDGRYERSAGTAIYYLLDEIEFSAFHRVKHDEVFHFYFGEAVELYILKNSREYEKIVLGTDLENGMRPQALVPAGHWQALKVKSQKGFSLLGATVCPGFEFEDFEVARYENLSKEYEGMNSLLKELTRN